MWQPPGSGYSSPTPWTWGDIIGAAGQAYANARTAQRTRANDNWTRQWQVYQSLPPDQQQKMYPSIVAAGKAAGVKLPDTWEAKPDPQAQQAAYSRLQLKMKQLQADPDLKNDQAFLASMAADYQAAFNEPAPFVTQQTSPGTPATPATPGTPGQDLNAPTGAQNTAASGTAALGTPATPPTTEQVPFFAATSQEEQKTFGDYVQGTPSGQQLAQRLHAAGLDYILDEPITSPADVSAAYTRAQTGLAAYAKGETAQLPMEIESLVAQASDPDPKKAAAAQQKLLQFGQQADRPRAKSPRPKHSPGSSIRRSRRCSRAGCTRSHSPMATP